MGQRAPDLMAASGDVKQNEWWIWALLAVTLLGGALRFAMLGAKTLWLDEAFSLWMARHELSSLFSWLIRIDHHPPLYYIFLHTWIGWLGDSPTALRSLSALTSTAAIPFYALGARRLAGGQAGIVAALLLAIAPFHIRYAQETRMYGLLTLAVALCLFALAYVLAPGRGATPRRHWWAWALLAMAEAAAMLTHNTATVLVPLALNGAVVGLWVAHRRGWLQEELAGLTSQNFVRLWLSGQIGALLLWSPWAYAFVRQAQVVDGDFWIEQPNTWTVWIALGNLTFAYLPDWLPCRDYWAWVGVVLVLWGILQWRRRGGLTWVLLVLWLVPPAVELLASLRRPIFYDRTLIWTTLPYYLLIARGMVLPSGVRNRWRKGWLLLSLLLFGVLSLLGVQNYYRSFVKENWDDVAQFVAETAQPKELVLFHASWAELPFDYYYRDFALEGAPPILKHGIPANLFDAGVLEPPMTEADVPRLMDLTEGHDELWLVYSHWWYTDAEGLLLRVLDEEFVAAEEREWPGIRVIRYARK